MDDIAYMVSVQPVLVSTILFFVCVILMEISIDFIMALIFPRWHSPCGFKSRRRGNHTQN